MGGLSSRAQPVAEPQRVALHMKGVQPASAEDAESLTDRETRMLEKFFMETMRLKEWLAADGHLAQALRKEDNSAYGSSNFVPTPLPRDADGFVRTFEPQDEAGIRDFFETYGLVVVRGAVDSEACERSRGELWDLLERDVRGLDRADATTWEKWADLASLGFVGNTFCLSPQICRNRQAPNVHAAFAAVFGRRQLHVNVGRLGATRPTRDVPGLNGADKPEWATIAGHQWVHWDANPWTGGVSSCSWHLPDPAANRGYRFAVQAILALGDCPEEAGGFYCVPGSHKVFRAWPRSHELLPADKLVMSPEGPMQVYLPENDPLKQAAETAPIREGDILIWNAHLAHCNFPNSSGRLRLVQYIQMKLADDPVIAPLFDDASLLPPASEFELTPLGRKLLNMEAW